MNEKTRLILFAQHHVTMCPEPVRRDLGFACAWGDFHILLEEDGIYSVEVRREEYRSEDGPAEPGDLCGVYKLQADESARLRRLLAETRLPLVAGHDMMRGYDGSTTTLSFAVNGLGASYTWWCDPPAGWEPLAEIAEIVLRLGVIEW